MQSLPQTTPQQVNKIEHFIVRFTDGTVVKVVVGEGEGYFREEEFKGNNKSFTTHQCFVANGTLNTIQSGKP